MLIETCPWASDHVRVCVFLRRLAVEGKNGSRYVEQKCVSQRFRESARHTSRVARGNRRVQGGGCVVRVVKWSGLCVYVCVCYDQG